MKKGSIASFWENSLLLPRRLYKERSSKKRKIANLAFTRYPILPQICKQLNYDISYQKDGMNWDIFWIDGAVSTDFVSSMRHSQRINHFPGMSNLSINSLLVKNLRRMQKAFPQSYSFFPLTFLLPQDIFLLKKYERRAKIKGDRLIFIVKPRKQCERKGVYLWQESVELQAKREIIQTYIERPLLYKGYKFDLRVYVLLARCVPMKLYLYSEGLVRFASELYQLPSSRNILELGMHLTNYSIDSRGQKQVVSDYQGELGKSHIKSLADLFEGLRAMGLPAEFYWEQIKDIAVKTLIAGLPWLKRQYEVARSLNEGNSVCFQLLELSFMIEESHKVYLLNMSDTPELYVESPFERHLKSHLVKDIFELVNREQVHKKGERNLRANSRVSSKNQRVYTQEVTFSVIKENSIEEKAEEQLSQQLISGGFQRIYPSLKADRQQKYENLISYSLGSVQFQPLPGRGIYQTPLIRKAASEPKKLPAFEQMSSPTTKRTIKLSKIVKPIETELSHSRMTNVFDRQSFLQGIKQQHKHSEKRRRKFYYQGEGTMKSNVSESVEDESMRSSERRRGVSCQRQSDKQSVKGVNNW